MVFMALSLKGAAFRPVQEARNICSSGILGGQKLRRIWDAGFVRLQVVQTNWKVRSELHRGRHITSILTRYQYS